jgi:hypothetical protein
MTGLGELWLNELKFTIIPVLLSTRQMKLEVSRLRKYM